MHASSLPRLKQYQVARLEKRRKWLNLSVAEFRGRVGAALKEEGHKQSDLATQRRIERALYKPRRALSETTRRVLARGYGWTLLELEKLLRFPRLGAEEQVRRLLFKKPREMI